MSDVDGKKWYNDEIRQPEEFERRESLKLMPGMHRIKITSDGREFESEFDGQMVQKVVFDVEYAGKPYSWFVTKGQTTESFYGQLVQVARKLNGMSGHELGVVVTGIGKNRRQQIIDIDGVPAQ